MLDIKMINDTIEELENAETTFFNCQNLAHLYIVRDHFRGLSSFDAQNVGRQLSDILPQYQRYVSIKRRYQLHEIGEDAVITSIKEVCKEIKEFIRALYNNTDMSQEREQIKLMISELFKEPL